MMWTRRVVVASVMVLMSLTWPIVAIAAQLTLTWIDASTRELGFAVERSTGTTGPFAEVTRTGPAVTTYTDPTVVALTTYCYRVRAFDAVGYSAYSNTACGTPVTGVGLAVVKIDTGGGTVTSAPAGINCGASCSAGYASGTAVTLTAIAATGSTFTGWTGGGCSGTGTCTVTMTATTTVTAAFALKSASALGVTPQSLTFSKIVGQPNPLAQTVTVTAPAGKVWATYDTMPFANVIGLPSVPSGVTGTGPAAFQVVPSSGMTSLAVGVYNGSIAVSASGFADLMIPVQVIVMASAPPPPPPAPPPPPPPNSLSVTPQSLTFSKIVGQPNPLAQTVTVTAPAGKVWATYDTMPFANVIGLPSVPSGVTGTGSATFQVVPSSGMTFLGPGVYYESIAVSASGFADIKIPVLVIVTASPPPNSLSVTPQSLTFAKIAGQPNPPAQTVTVTAPAGKVWATYDTMPFANVIGLPSVPGGITGTGSATFQVVPSSGMTFLGPDVYYESIAVSTSGFADLVIPVLVIVTAP